MLNEDYKKQAIKDLEKINQEYMCVFRRAVHDMERLQQTRSLSVRTIQDMERYVVMLANRPKNFDTKIGEIKLRYIKFLDACKKIQELEQERIEKDIQVRYGMSGILAGAGIAAFGPTAAMSVAMTFGTASTGTAIASLSGAAATNAALAWLGGGALAVGGTGLGMAGGQALLAAAGPIGWVIGGVSLAGSLVAINLSNKEVAEKTEQSIVELKREMERIKEIDIQVLSWNDETKKLSNAISSQLHRIKGNRKRDYKLFTESELNELTSLFNSTEVLSKKLGDTIGEKR